MKTKMARLTALAKLRTPYGLWLILEKGVGNKISVNKSVTGLNQYSKGFSLLPTVNWGTI
jgi:hypothetical protein